MISRYTRFIFTPNTSLKGEQGGTQRGNGGGLNKNRCILRAPCFSGHCWMAATSLAAYPLTQQTNGLDAYTTVV